MSKVIFIADFFMLIALIAAFIFFSFFLDDEELLLVLIPYLFSFLMLTIVLFKKKWHDKYKLTIKTFITISVLTILVCAGLTPFSDGMGLLVVFGLGIFGIALAIVASIITMIIDIKRLKTSN